jgi:hypothetical protein
MSQCQYSNHLAADSQPICRSHSKTRLTGQDRDGSLQKSQNSFTEVRICSIQKRDNLAHFRTYLRSAENLAKAQTATSVLFDSDLSRLEPEDVLTAFEGDKRLVKIGNEDLGQPLSRLAVQVKLVKSRGK